MIPAALLFSAQLLGTQNDKPVTLRASARVVEVDVSVRDSQGKAVEDLRKEDFTILDDGKPRAFTIFSANTTGAKSAPGSTPALLPRPVLKPGTFTNIGEPPPSREGHSTVILLDGINGWFDNFAYARKGVLGMLSKVPEDEKIALYVVSKGEGLLMLQDYTLDRARLLEAMTKYIPHAMCQAPPGPEELGEGMMEGPPIYRKGALEDSARDSADAQLAKRKAAMAAQIGGPPCKGGDSLERGVDSVRLALNTLSETLGRQPGRKSVYWMTQGFPPAMLRGVYEGPWTKTVSALNDANIAVNTIDSNGKGGPHRFWGGGPIRSMQQIAEETGGKAYYGRNDLDGALLEGIADSRISYTLGFYLTEVDARYHELKVNVNRPGLTLNHRQGYYALDEPKIDASQKKSELSAALLNSADSAAVGIVASLDRKPGSPRDMLNVRLRLDPDTLSTRESKAGLSGKVEEMFVEFNAADREVGRISATSPFDIKPENRDAFQTNGVTMVQSFAVPADAVKLTIIVRDSGSGRIGSLSVPLDAVK